MKEKDSILLDTHEKLTVEPFEAKFDVTMQQLKVGDVYQRDKRILIEVKVGVDAHDYARLNDELHRMNELGYNTPELQINFAEGEHYKFMEKFIEQASFENANIITIDGLRVNYAEGWGLIRPSNTTPCLVLRFEANDENTLAEIQNTFRKQILAVDSTLKLPF